MTDPLHQLEPQPSEGPSAEFAETLRRRVEAIEGRTQRTQARSTSWHLAELNLGVFRDSLESPTMSEFAGGLDRINALADEAPGFVWRLTDVDGGPSSNIAIPGDNDPLLASNLSVWEDYESLRNYMYRTDHVSYLRRRSEWFEHRSEAMTVAWWIPAGQLPTLEDALRRLQLLRDHGPSDEGWPLTQPRPAPSLDPTATVPGVAAMLIPYLTVGDSRAAIDFYAEVFDAEQRGDVFEMEDGRVGHAELAIGGQTLYLADDFPEIQLVHPAGHGGPKSMSLVIRVHDCDAIYDRALAAGATSERAPENAHGRRIAWFVDPWGHRWSPTSEPVD